MNESLVAAVRAAFPTGNPPARPVTDHRCIECDDIDAHLGGRTWPDVAFQVLPAFADAFPLLTFAAQAYYLPAYLCLDLRDPSQIAGLSVSSALESRLLDPDAFTAAQRAAVWAWALVYYRDEPVGVPPDSVAKAWGPREG